MNATASPAELFDAALERVESKSIRAWAESNRDGWLKIVAAGIAKRDTIKGAAREACATENPARLSSYIVATAIGLI